MKKAFIILAFIIALLGVGFALYANKVLSETTIYSNVYVEDINLGGLSISDASKLLTTKYDTGSISFAYHSSHRMYDLKRLGYEYDIDQSVQEAFNIGRDRDIFSNVLQVFLLERGYSQHVTIDKKENFAAFEKVFDELEQSINIEPVDAQIIIESTISVIEGKKGRKVDRAALSQKVKKYLENPDSSPIEVPVIEEDEKIKADYLRQINGIIGEYHTTFNNRILGRNHNIRLAASRIDHVLLQPGEVFSFNEKNGEISVAAGYVDAPVIVKGELQEGVGGGVCQVTSTLYNSVLLSDLKIVERKSHSIPSGYVPVGRDATIFGNIIDFKFANDKEYPIYIRSYVHGNTVKVIIYGDVNRHPKVSLTSTVSEVIPKTIQKINDATLPLGKEEIEKPGRDGIKSVTHLTVNGVTRIVSKDHYPMAPETIRIGTGPAEMQSPLLQPDKDPSVFVPELNIFEPINP